jgi:hypothetical protein
MVLKTWFTAGLLLSLFGLCLLSSVAQAGHYDRAGSQGRFAIDLSWTNDPDTGEDALRGFIQYIPSAGQPACSRLTALQIARVKTESGDNLIWEAITGQSARNSIRTADGFFVDHDALKCQPRHSCSPYFRDSWPNASESSDGSISASGAISPASMIDYPYGWLDFASIELETCMVCATDSRVLDCVSWGARWGNTTPQTFISPVVGPESATFKEALARFNSFY